MRLAILGFGVEGRSVYNYFKRLGSEYKIDVFDEKTVSDNVVKITMVKKFTDIDFSKYDLIVRSPSVRPSRNQKKPRLTSATQIFFDNCPAPIVGVTGTKGKGSTASFITKILEAAGRTTVHLVGNIGVPALDELPKIKASDVVVYELSSFQLWDLTSSPQVAVLTIMETDHLDVHKDFAEYVSAKARIVRYQSAADFVVYNRLDSTAASMAKSSKAQKLPYPRPELENLARGAIKLAGDHQVRNAEAAILAARAVWPDLTDAQIRAGLAAFDGLPHRLKFVAEKAGVKYYDDSIATTPGSAIAAIKSFIEPKVLILGGSDKGADYTEVGAVAEFHGVRRIFAIGANRAKVEEQVSEKFSGEITLLDEQNMAQLVPKIASVARPGEVVILSPAAASFDMFKNYADRGQQFIEAVSKL